MSNVIAYLEALARDPNLLDRSGHDLILEGIDANARAALLARDPIALNKAIRAPENVACLIFAPEKDEPGQDDAPGREDEGEQPADPDTRAA